jgi:hypothetical protein
VTKELPEIDLDELARFKEKNFRQRLEFQDMYVEWLKKTGNVKWSSPRNPSSTEKLEEGQKDKLYLFFFSSPAAPTTKGVRGRIKE